MRFVSFLLALVPSMVQAQGPQVVDKQGGCKWSEPAEIYVGKVTLEHYKNTVAGTYTMRFTYTQGNAWVSIGVNHDGSSRMAPSNAVIGRIEYAEDGTSVLRATVL
jgi:hypothetical protein